jgi:DNA primase
MNVRALLAKLKIEVVEEVGEHLWARCPYHQDTKPSWRIRMRGERCGLHWCFACHEGGDLVDLVMQVRDYAVRPSAIAWLEENAEQVDAADTVAPVVDLTLRDPWGRGFRMPRGVERSKLEDWPTIPRTYVLARGLTEEQIGRWKIGFAAEGKLGGRIVIPIQDRMGNFCSYMARAWSPDAKRKYLYPSEAEGPQLDVMFGELGWTQYTPCVVTEGALKSLAVERAFPRVSHAALGGSGVRPLHLGKLTAMHFSRVVVMTDNDDAGNRAGDELVRGLARHVPTMRCRLDPGQDADSIPLAALRSALAPYVT